jgi:hypothetical protein
VCQPSGGCRLNGNYCDSTAACCNVNHLIAESKEVDCDPVDHVCTNGGACNPPGDICGLNANASQNCCFGKKDVCRYDSNGIPRCFGGPPGHCDGNGCDETCPIGWDGNDPQCCIPPGTGPESICQFRDQCCGFAPCVPDATGVLHCAAVTTCKPQGSPCAGAGDTSCCTGSTCQDLGSELEWRCADAGGGIGCDPIGAGCASNVECCSGVCDPVNDVCVAACVAGGGACTVGADCCAGLACDIAPGATSGVCNDPDGGGGPTCAATGQGCAISADCCNDATGEDCIAGVCTVAASTCSETYQVCTVDANCCGDLQCYGLTDLEAQRPCGDPGIVGACFCDVPPAYSCIEETQPCSSILPCCPTQPLYCGSKAAGGGPCTSTNTADCECKPVG